MYPHKRHLSPKVRAFVDFLAEKFTPIPPWELGLRDARSVRKPEAVAETKAIAAPVTEQQS